MTIRTKFIVNITLFAIAALYLAYHELRTFHPNLFGV
jgi:hypothetical protein